MIEFVSEFSKAEMIRILAGQMGNFAAMADLSSSFDCFTYLSLVDRNSLYNCES
jgi:hypothetical protein